MAATWAITPPYFLAFSFVCGVVGFRMGWRTKKPLALPLLQGGLGWIAFLVSNSFLGTAWAAACVGAWAFGTSLVAVYVFVRRPEETDARVIRAAEYRKLMLDWLESGRGPETRVVATVTQHVRELIWYAAAAAVTANLLSTIMGALLLNYINAYVATLVRAARRRATVFLLAWNVWSVVRVAAYVALGAAASGPLLQLAGRRVDTGAVRALAWAGAAGAVVDLVLKLALSRPCGRVLAGAVDLAAAQANRSSEVTLSVHLD